MELARMPRLPAPLLSLTAAVSWGAMFPIADHVLPRVDPFAMTAIRYGLGSLAFLAILAAVEGSGALRFDGNFRSLFLLGSVGFAGFNLLSFVGLQHTSPQGAAIIVATMPLITALVLWARGGHRPTRATTVAIAVALVGAGLVVTKGDLASGWGIGDVLVLFGVLSWVVYTTGAARFPELSPLRYTTLTASTGTLTVLGATAVAVLIGQQTVPSPADLSAEWAGLAFVTVFGAIIAVLSWNAGVRRLGAANATLFINLVPITALAIRIAGGYQPAAAEYAGTGLVIAALVGANVAARLALPRSEATNTPVLGRSTLSVLDQAR
jgi:drug/metabolite transporter (DMT)-like permease